MTDIWDAIHSYSYVLFILTVYLEIISGIQDSIMKNENFFPSLHSYYYSLLKISFHHFLLLKTSLRRTSKFNVEWKQ